jgi:hypothetical protein
MLIRTLLNIFNKFAIQMLMQLLALCFKQVDTERYVPE